MNGFIEVLGLEMDRGEYVKLLLLMIMKSKGRIDKSGDRC